MKVFLCLLALLAFSYSQSTCTACEYIVKTVEGALQNQKTEQEILNVVEEACLLFPTPFNAECQAIVNEKGPAIIKALIQGAAPETVCGFVGLCTPKRVVEDVQQAGCSVCTLVVSYVESYLAQNQTEAQIVQNLDQVCSLLGPLASTCDQFVLQYVPQLIQWIEAGESPAVFCKQVGLCSAQKRSVEQGGCGICQLVVSYVESYIERNQTEAQIIQQLDQVCSLLGPLASECDQFVLQYVPQLIQWIEAGESPAIFCKQVGLCSSSKRVVAENQQAGCSVCTLVVSYVESYMAQNQTEAQIVQQLDQVCALLGPLASTCDQFVLQYVPQLIQWIEAGESPAIFCKQVGLCSSSKRAVEDVQQAGCSVCTLVVSYVESYLAQNQTEAQIVQQLDQVCSLLGPLASTCDQFVLQYVPQLIQWIEAGESPAVFCKQVGLCSAQKRSAQQGGGCSVCQLVVSYVETFLQQNKSINLLEGELDQLCSLLGPLSSTCDSFVALYTPQLVQWIISNEPPQAFCAQVGLCSIPSRVQNRPTIHTKPKF